MPEKVELTIETPPGASPRRFIKEVYRRCNKEAERIRHQVAAEGGSFLGALDG